MNVLSRMIGFTLLQSLAARLPARYATTVQFSLVIVGSLLPIVPLSMGVIELVDVLVYTVAGLAVSVVTTLIRLHTMSPRTSQSVFFMLHYSIMIGVLSILCGAGSIILLVFFGSGNLFRALVPTFIAVVLANAWLLADGWFLRGGRRLATVWSIVSPGYLRFVPVLIFTILALVFYGSGETAARIRILGILLVLTTATIDMSLTAVEMGRLRRLAEQPPEPATADLRTES